MCFTNKTITLNRLRKGKKPLKVWKVASYDEKTGIASTNYLDTKKTYTEWKIGTVVKAHLIRKPLNDGQEAGSGLYFYTHNPDANYHLGRNEIIITATVKPKDIIAANCSIICVTAATVIGAPTITPAQAKIAWLQKKVKSTILSINSQNAVTSLWEKEGRDVADECLKQMIAEIKELKAKS